MSKKFRRSRKKVSRQYKDRLFRLIFREKKDLLDLYNAVNLTSYTNPEELQITTLEDVVYIGMKNDISFLIGDILSLYEHQSSFNPNMPLRGFLYFADLLRSFLEPNLSKLYGSRLISLPLPQFVVFYNGTQEEPDRQELRLSDSFPVLPRTLKPCLECRVTVLNINLGHNRELLARCSRLQEYSVFVAKVREQLRRGVSLEDAAAVAVDTCIRENILADILRKNRAEVMNLILTEFDAEGYRQVIRQEGWEDGWEDGYKAGMELSAERLKSAEAEIERLKKLLSQKQTGES